MLRNSTIQPKKKNLSCGHHDYEFSKGRCRACASQGYKPIKKISDKRMDIIQQDDLQGLIEDCDATLSKYIRIKYAKPNGVCECFTCGTEKRWQDLQNGHFIPRSNLATRFLDDNCRPQCVGCNCIAHGNLEVFEQKLNEENAGIVEYLREQGNQVWKPSRYELKELLVELRNKLKIAQLKLIHKL